MHRTHMQDLKDITQDVHYENFRKKKLLQGGGAWVYCRWVGLYCGHYGYCYSAEDIDAGMPVGGGGMQEEMRRKEKEVCV